MSKRTKTTGSANAPAPTTTESKTAPNKPYKHCGPSYSLHNLPRYPAKMQELTQPHRDSFDFFLEHALHEGVKAIPAQELTVGDANKTKLTWWLDSVTIGQPTKNDGSSSKQLLPRECRERGMVYGAPMTGVFKYAINEGDQHRLERSLGVLPIMVLSNRCRLRGKSANELQACKEEVNEFGGYFIVNGIERVMRILQVPRRDYAVAVQRNAFKNRGPLYSDKAITMRCARPDQSTQTVALHYLNNGSATLRFAIRKQEFLVPVLVVLRALSDCTDMEIYQRLLQGEHDNMFLAARLELLLHDGRRWQANTRSEALSFLGARFRTVMQLPDGEQWTDAKCGSALLSRHVLVHCSTVASKFECLLHMCRKLYSFVQGRCVADNADALSSHELLLPGHLFSMFVKEKLDEGLQAVRLNLMRDARITGVPALLSAIQHKQYFAKALDRCVGGVGAKCVSLLSTGNVISTTGLDLMQVSGFTVVADRLNALRYMSHFRAVHRGQFFTTMKTTTVRKLLPESWGFLCPVHTPDGGPCGLLQHLALKCTAICEPPPDRGMGLKKVVVALGVTPSGVGGGDGQLHLPFTYLPVLIDGEVVGGAPAEVCAQVASALRYLKVNGTPGATTSASGSDSSSSSSAKGKGKGKAAAAGKKGKNKKKNSSDDSSSDNGHSNSSSSSSESDGSDDEGDDDDEDSASSAAVAASSSSSPPHGLVMKDGMEVDASLEVAWVPPPPEGQIGAYPGLYLFTRSARIVRPVLNLQALKTELIGPLEQVYLEVAALPGDVRSVHQDSEHPSTHLELDPTNMLSLIASLTPFSDYNQGPRIMYQCQMGKQTMGTPAHSIDQHPDNKAYKIQTPQAPLVQTRRHAEFQMDDYPQGTNAVVAVISYTGYDMEDAMILNKSSYERGFAHASVYKTKVVDLAEERKRSAKPGSGTGGGGLKFGNYAPRSKTNRNKPKPPLSGEAAHEDDASRRNANEEVKVYDALDDDGLPHVGDFVKEGDPLVCVVDELTGDASAALKHKENEPAYVQTVRALGAVDASGMAAGGSASSGSSSSAGTKKGREPISRVAITLRFTRNPIIGDKFSSRHGQKGVMSILWPQADMPFSESGISPDVIINPHAFPSRMTMGMLLESLAGKSGALGGHYQDATPFSFSEEHTAVDYFGAQLAKQGYAYYGSEPLYSGVSGTVMHADIFIGVVYYQRLRHMVSDKSQVRAIGPINSLTRQPIKGRKRHGGIRLGEMERDALLAHGSSFLLMDRLFNCSDKHVAYVCTNPACGSLLAPTHALKSGVGSASTRSGLTQLQSPSSSSSSSSTSQNSSSSGGSVPGGKAVASGDSAGSSAREGGFVCKVCHASAQNRSSQQGGHGEAPPPSHCEPVALPYVFRYLTNELAGMNIRMTLQLGNWKP